jgi:sterile alpha motif and leucine zipper-containing kinase AZK
MPQAGPKSYYPAFRKSGATTPRCVIEVNEEKDLEEAIREIPSPTKSRARRARRSQELKAPSEVPDTKGAERAVERKDNEAFGQIAVSSDVFKVNPAELKLGERIGYGTSAEVFRASWHGTDVAVKRLRGPLPSEFQRELAVLSRLRHPHLVLFMGACTTGPPKIISELCEGGTLFHLLHQQKEVQLSWRQRLKAAVDTAKGMAFLHSQRVVHRDLKSLNLLLVARVNDRSPSPWVKVADFGLSRFQPSSAPGPSTSVMTGGVGTAFWMAPEVLSGNSYNEKVDVYSFSIVLYELLCRWIPFDGTGLEQVSIAVAVTSGRRPDLRYLPPDCPPSLSGLMTSCWAHCADQRPTFEAALDLLKQTNS